MSDIELIGILIGLFAFGLFIMGVEYVRLKISIKRLEIERDQLLSQYTAKGLSHLRDIGLID